MKGAQESGARRRSKAKDCLTPFDKLRTGRAAESTEKRKT
jgi:hypothetical protein